MQEIQQQVHPSGTPGIMIPEKITERKIDKKITKTSLCLIFKTIPLYKIFNQTYQHFTINMIIVPF